MISLPILTAGLGEILQKDGNISNTRPEGCVFRGDFLISHFCNTKDADRDPIAVEFDGISRAGLDL